MRGPRGQRQQDSAVVGMQRRGEPGMDVDRCCAFAARSVCYVCILCVTSLALSFSHAFSKLLVRWPAARLKRHLLEGACFNLEFHFRLVTPGSICPGMHLISVQFVSVRLSVLVYVSTDRS